MADNKRGGYRPGAGRKKTGRTKKCITLTLPIEFVEKLSAASKAKGVSMSNYILDNFERFEIMIDEEPKPYIKG